MVLRLPPLSGMGRFSVVEAAGRVAIAVDHVVPVGLAYWLVTPAGAETGRKIVDFRNWLLGEMSLLRRNGHRQQRAAAH